MNEKQTHDCQTANNPDAEGGTRKIYRSPQLKEWGTVSDLTGVGKSHPGGDMRFGSVFPPGHKNRM